MANNNSSDRADQRHFTTTSREQGGRVATAQDRETKRGPEREIKARASDSKNTGRNR